MSDQTALCLCGDTEWMHYSTALNGSVINGGACHEEGCICPVFWPTWATPEEVLALPTAPTDLDHIADKLDRLQEWRRQQEYSTS